MYSYRRGAYYARVRARRTLHVSPHHLPPSMKHTPCSKFAAVPPTLFLVACFDSHASLTNTSSSSQQQSLQ